jgi:hypothetical protein
MSVFAGFVHFNEPAHFIVLYHNTVKMSTPIRRKPPEFLADIATFVRTKGQYAQSLQVEFINILSIYIIKICNH